MIAETSRLENVKMLPCVLFIRVLSFEYMKNIDEYVDEREEESTEEMNVGIASIWEETRETKGDWKVPLKTVTI